MMINFLSFLSEAVEHVGGIQHIEHPSDRTFDGKDAAQHAVNTLRGAARGSSPISRKIDDKMSYNVIKTPDGRVGVKYKGAGSHYNFTPEDVDTQHGHKPYLAHPLKLLLEHLPKVLPDRPGEYQGGYMSDPSMRTISNGRISHQPNTIEYSVPTDTKEGQKLRNSKVSTVIHSELTGPNREAHPVTDLSEFKEHPDVHMVSHLVSHDEQHGIDPVAKRQALSHLDRAEKLMKNHTYDHLSGHEIPLRTYINSTVSSGEEPTVEGYKAHLARSHQKKIDAVKMQKTKDAKTAERDAALKHVEENAKSFDKSLKIHGHVQQATNILARALSKTAHGGYGHAIEGKETGPEGFVSGGLKIVDRGEGGFSQANRARSAILRASPKLTKMVS
jgi:hypothetical protein